MAPGSLAVAIYGSTSAGIFDEQSDIDILVIGDGSQVDHDRVLALWADDRSPQRSIPMRAPTPSLK